MGDRLTSRAGAWLGLDVGGANLKGAHEEGIVRSRPFALWKAPGRLASRLTSFLDEFPPFDGVLLTMTAELCDCFETKREGVLAVLSAVETTIGGRVLEVWGVDGAFHEPQRIRESPSLAAASNWRALAEFAARRFQGESGLLVDLGSTTADLIPILHGKVAAIGRCDAERLRTGELVYVGARRTPVCALANALPFGGSPTRLMAELFATTLDVYLCLGELAEDPDDRDTADGRPATRAFARDRLARMVGADRETFSEADALRLSEAADAAVLDRLIEAGSQVTRLLGRPRRIVTAGSGEFVATRLAERLVAPGGRIDSLGQVLGPEASAAACAVALTKIRRVDRVEG